MTNPRPRQLHGAPSEPDGGQSSFVNPVVPEDHVVPPGATQFANATWLKAGPEVRDLVAEVLGFEEFEAIADLDYAVVWRRQTHPMRGEDAVFATCEIVQPRIIWQAYQMGEEQFPRFFIDLHWQHFDDLRRGHVPGTKPEDDGPPEGRTAQYVHQGILQQHLHHALSFLEVENDIIRKRAPEWSGFAATIQRFGLWTSSARAVARQMSLWFNKSDEAVP